MSKARGGRVPVLARSTQVRATEVPEGLVVTARCTQTSRCAREAVELRFRFSGEDLVMGPLRFEAGSEDGMAWMRGLVGCSARAAVPIVASHAGARNPSERAMARLLSESLELAMRWRTPLAAPDAPEAEGADWLDVGLRW